MIEQISKILSKLPSKTVAKLRLALLNISIPISKLISKVHRPDMIITSEDYLDAKSKLKNGDVLCTTVLLELSNIFIPGIFKHCGIYIDGFVYEATTHNVRKVTLEEFMFKKDIIGVSRAQDEITETGLKKGIQFLIDQLGEPYDYGFSFFSTNTWYCSKYCYEFFCTAIEGFDKKFTLLEVLSMPTVVPDDFWLATKVFNRISSYNVK